jgi:hypothetical protein
MDIFVIFQAKSLKIASRQYPCVGLISQPQILELPSLDWELGIKKKVKNQVFWESSQGAKIKPSTLLCCV